MRCKNIYCRWNYNEESCSYPYGISIDENGFCDRSELRNESEDE